MQWPLGVGGVVLVGKRNEDEKIAINRGQQNRRSALAAGVRPHWVTGCRD